MTISSLPPARRPMSGALLMLGVAVGTVGLVVAAVYLFLAVM